jgi:hypothetical protein
MSAVQSDHESDENVGQAELGIRMTPLTVAEVRKMTETERKREIIKRVNYFHLAYPNIEAYPQGPYKRFIEAAQEDLDKSDVEDSTKRHVGPPSVEVLEDAFK